MRTIQEIFDAVIDGGFYDAETSIFMCWALVNARSAKVITRDERDTALDEIEEYLGGWYALQIALQAVGLPRSFPDRLAIYRNWAIRPQLIAGTDI